jgi:NTE family protein
VTPERIVLVLSGGGMKAMAHIGVLRALEECGLHPTEIVGTSGGALIGALAAGGLDYDELVPRVMRIRARDVVVPAKSALLLRGVGAASVLRSAPLRALLRRIVPVNDFGALLLPLRITATDLDSGELVVFGAGGRGDCTVAEAVYASMALPVYYPPARIGGRRFADGGIRAVLPLDVAAAIPADLVVAVDVGPVPFGPAPGDRQLPALVALSDRALAIAMADQKARTLAAWRAAAGRPTLLLVTPDVDPNGTFAFDRTAEFIEAGYRAAHAVLAARAAG